ncbi:MAG TPA: matrixin family metalloprotease [Gemmatimonadaceae bacterium]|nr:matrixin family metalloprotease [Gemmatimonadaceae bacterium]
MMFRAAGASRPFAGMQSAGGMSRGTRVRRAAQWLLAALLLCEWRYPPPDVLLSEQRSARSALSVKRCRKAAACVPGRGAVGSWSDSLTYLSFDDDGTSTIRRWPDDGLPITVWIGESGGPRARAVARRHIARDAFHAWSAAGVPERFSFVSDSASAMVHVIWRRQLPDRRAGQVTRQTDAEGWLRSAVVELSVRNIVGAVQDTATLRAVALHEVGHVIGLEHSPDERDIMAPWVVARRISERDRATANAIYGVGFYEDDR